MHRSQQVIGGAEEPREVHRRPSGQSKILGTIFGSNYRSIGSNCNREIVAAPAPCHPVTYLGQDKVHPTIGSYSRQAHNKLLLYRVGTAFS